MKTYTLADLKDDAWKEIDFIFWRSEVPCLPKGSSGDGFLIEEIETTKRGVEISGTMSFLGGGRECFEHPMVLCLSRPRFSSIDSVTAEKVRKAGIREAAFDGETLLVTVD